MDSVAVDKQKIILEFIISHLDEDQRPYLNIMMKFVGLLDSGATRSIMGTDVWAFEFGYEYSSFFAYQSR